MLNGVHLYMTTSSKSVIRILIFMALGLLALSASSTVLAGKIYKWTDADGNVHYGSEKPADTEAESIKVDTEKTGVTTGADALDRMIQEDEDKADKIKEEGIPAQPPVPTLPMKEVKRRCNQAKQLLAAIDKTGQLRERDEKGNIRYVSEEERQAQIKSAKKMVREYCR